MTVISPILSKYALPLVYSYNFIVFIFIVLTIYSASLNGRTETTDLLCSYSPASGLIDIFVSGGTTPYQYSVRLSFLLLLLLQGIVFIGIRLMEGKHWCQPKVW